jgi:ribosome-interacting GTPase 1
MFQAILHVTGLDRKLQTLKLEIESKANQVIAAMGWLIAKSGSHTVKLIASDESDSKVLRGMQMYPTENLA